ncbi:glycoside hydrolase family 55 protein [Favolaschia claudopus]|uniref:Glycoside hydrolase family 55 protein n=1 Tax=Favolaschia claudopus TaxID=2862362 RepID=A0AAW0A876_9AGAR
MAHEAQETNKPGPRHWLSIEQGIIYHNSTTGPLVERAGTEAVTCYNKGTKARPIHSDVACAEADRAPIVSVIDDWCGRVIGTHLNDGQEVMARYNYGTFTVLVSAKAINGCNIIIDGNCDRLLRLPVDKCNTGGVNGKQGGFETDLCGQWNTDPGCCGSDF